MPKVILIAAITGFFVSTALLAGVAWYAGVLRASLISCSGPLPASHGVLSAHKISLRPRP